MATMNSKGFKKVAFPTVFNTKNVVNQWTGFHRDVLLKARPLEYNTRNFSNNFFLIIFFFVFEVGVVENAFTFRINTMNYGFIPF